MFVIPAKIPASARRSAGADPHPTTLQARKRIADNMRIRGFTTFG
jgi:hypothetical protein